MPLDHAPLQQFFLDANGYVQRVWAAWFRGASSAANTVAHEQMSGQSAAVGVTPISSPSLKLAAGIYEVSTYTQVTKADGVSSAVQVTVSWTAYGQVMTDVGVNVNGDSLTSVDKKVFPIRVDQGTPVTFSTTYASNTPAKMQYGIDVVLKAIPDPVTV